MNFKRGKDRFVLVFPSIGIVIKLPVIRINRVIDRVRSNIKRKDWKRLWSDFLKWNPENHYAISGMLLRGVMANQREGFLWKRTRNSFLQPTIFSFFGLVNIQKYAVPYPDDGGTSFWIQIRKITHEDVYCNPHQFSEPKNFCLVDGRLRILDYGGQGSTWIVVKHGRKIMEQFDPDFLSKRPEIPAKE